MVESLIKEISSIEVRTALLVVGKNVCRITNGLSLEFFLQYWDYIADAFIASLQEVFHLGSMLVEWNERMTYLIPKVDGVVDDIKKWRHKKQNKLLDFEKAYEKSLLNFFI